MMVGERDLSKGVPVLRLLVLGALASAVVGCPAGGPLGTCGSDAECAPGYGCRGGICQYLAEVSLLDAGSQDWGLSPGDAGAEAGSPDAASLPDGAPGHDALILLVNCGDLAGGYVDTHGRTWQADQDWFGVDHTVVRDQAMEILGTDDDVVYRHERYWAEGVDAGPGGYRLALADGVYTVQLHFAETSPRAQVAGDRVFDVDVDGSRRYALDLLALGSRETAVIERFGHVVVDDGVLDIVLTPSVHSPELNGIEVHAGASPPQCGDLVCDEGVESAAACPGDCGPG